MPYESHPSLAGLNTEEILKEILDMLEPGLPPSQEVIA